MSAQLSAPALSVILPASSGFANVARTVRALCAQTVCDRLELVIVTPDGDIALDTAMADAFANVQVIAGGIPLIGARVAGVKAARAPIVALAEDHSFPEPDWAAALIAAHDEGTWAAVGPVVCNANPRGPMSWANFLLEYGDWIEPVARGPMGHLPGHNSSYRRDVLLSYGARLDELMLAESVLQWDLARNGHRLLIEPKARTRHLNFSRVSSSIALRFLEGRSFAATRASAWSLRKRISFVIGSPLIPVVRLRRALALIRRLPGRRELPTGTFPGLLMCLLFDALGEFMGYAAGHGSSTRLLSGIEADRYRFLSRADRRAYDHETQSSRQPA